MPIYRLIVFFIFAACCSQQVFAADEVALADSTVTISFVCQDAEPGETICVEVLVSNFIDIQSVLLSFNFDPSVMRFVSIQNEALTSGISSYPGPAEVRYIWVDPLAMSVDLVDGTTLFELCFEIVGIPGQSSSIDLSANSLQEITNSASEILPIITNPCVINVLNPNAVGATVTTCGSPDGIQNGDFTITVFGGTAPYTYTWTGPVNGMSNIANSGDSDTQSVPIGAYNLLVTDNTGATTMLSVTIMDNALLSAATPTDPTCYNFTNGRISVEATNGTAPYGFIWEHTTNSQYAGSAFILIEGGSKLLTSLPTGTYNITITDSDGCSAFESVTLDVDEFVFDNVVVTDATCIGSADGGVSISVSGATPDINGDYEFEFSWMAGTFTGNQINEGGLNPGSYAITISDAVVQCDTVFEFTIGAQLVITATIVLTEPSCPGSADGAALVTGVPAGTYDFQKLDSDGNPDGPIVPSSASANFVGLEAGLYGVILDDGACKSDTLWFTLTDPDPMTISILNIEPQGCQFMDGAISVQAMGGEIGPSSDYVYSWNGGALMGSTISNLTAGSYLLTVSDDNMCMIDTTIVVSVAQPPRIDSIVATDLSCTGAPITTLEVFFTEGSFPVTTIIWSNGGSTKVITNQSSGDTVFVTIRDDKFCFDISASYIIPGGSEFMIDSVRLESPTCPGDDDGQITVFSSGGVEPLTYIWSTGDTSTFNLLAGLTAGAYSVTIVDASDDSCGVLEIDVMLEDIESLDFFFTNIDSTGCSLMCTGQATLIPSGGDIGLPYNFFWASGLMETGAQSTATGLCGGWQVVNISQDNFCFFPDSVFIPFPPGITIDTVAFNGIVCSGMDDGFISLSASGGSGGYQYDWAVLPPGPVQTNLGSGTYYVTVTDSDMCAATDSFTIITGASVFLFLDTLTTKPIGCASGNDGAIGLQTVGGTPGYDYTWLPNVSSGPLAQMLGPGTYEITVTDQTGCTDSISVTLTEPEPIQTYLAEIVPPTCAGENTTISIDSVTGGNGTHTWSINGGQQYTLDDTVTVSVGFYSIIVLDEGSCKDTTMLVITSPPPIELSILPDDAIVKLGDSIQLLLTIDSTQGLVDSISWTHDVAGSLLSCYDCIMPYASNVLPTTYFVQVWDSAGCVALESIFVDVDNNRNVFIPNVFSPNQDGRNEDFKIFTGQGVLGIRSARVFNRWGELMVEIMNPELNPDGTFIWDGDFNGELMQPGVYVYMAEILFQDAPDQPLIYRGDVTLIR
ncbi:MAG: hypothetical protein DRI69_05300 [Bacteroidetes bacterium]|nr:MAG: hypothetical protein DRI69_05300 [Bacteroidota bacterium]